VKPLPVYQPFEIGACVTAIKSFDAYCSIDNDFWGVHMQHVPVGDHLVVLGYDDRRFSLNLVHMSGKKMWIPVDFDLCTEYLRLMI